LKCGASPDGAARGMYQGEAMCKPKSCGVPALRDFTRVIQTEILYPNIVTLSCSNGATLSGDPEGLTTYESICQEDGKFSETTEVCKPVVCGVAPVAATGATPIGVSPMMTYSMRASYQCQVGLSLDGTGQGARTFEVSCLESGDFSEASVCQPIFCGRPPALHHATGGSDSISAKFQDVIAYGCDAGYTSANADFSLMCEDDGTFHGIKPCLPVTCGEPPVVKHAAMPLGEVFFPTASIYQCDLGYTVSGKADGEKSFGLYCKADKTFEKPKECLPVDCSETLKGQNSAKLVTKVWPVLFPTVLDYQCDDGFSIDKTNEDSAKVWSQSCMPNGQMEVAKECQPIDDCLGHTCGPFGSCVDMFKNYTCKCESGYEISVQNDTGELICGNVDDCGPRMCGAGGVCKDLVNDYTCECDAGFELATIDDEKMCARVLCGTTPEVEHATAPLKKINFEEFVDYYCGSGYSLDGTATGDMTLAVHCLADRAFTDLPVCKPISCGAPPAAENSAVNVQPLVFPQAATYTCAKGHTLDGTATGPASLEVTCEASGIYSARPACKPVECGVAPATAMAHVETLKPLKYQEQASYQCFSGYATEERFPDKRAFSSPCVESGHFENVLSCKALVCDLPQAEDVPNTNSPIIAGPIDEAQPATIRFQQQASYECIEGHTINGKANGLTTFSVTCTDEGIATEPKTCQPVVCPKLPTVKFATLQANGTFTFGQEATYTCIPGYALSISDDFTHPKTSFTSSCTASGAFHGLHICVNIDDCAGHSCGPHGTCVDGIQKYTCACEEGFETTVLDNGDLFCGNKDDCAPDACGSYGTCIDMISGYTCECQAGYELVDVSDTDKMCEPKACPPLPAIGFSKHLQTVEMKYPKSVEVDCIEGYSTDGSVAAESEMFKVDCQTDAKLSPISSCLPIQCGFAPAFGNAMGPDPTEEFSFGQTAAFTCVEGYTLDGTGNGEKSKSLKCGKAGRFPAAGSCQPVACGVAPRMEGATVNRVQVSFPNEVTYQCDVGYSFDASNPSDTTFLQQCSPSGAFVMSSGPQNTEALSCTKLSCGEPPVVEQASYSAGPRVYGDSVVYQCAEGHSADGTTQGPKEWSITCQETGVFTASVAAACQLITFSIHGHVRDATSMAPVSGATIKLGGVTGTTDSHGAFDVSGVPMGMADLVAEKNGYIKGDMPVDVLQSALTGGHNELIISPELPPDGWRIVLSWAQEPRDLDSHLFFGEGQACHLYWGATRVTCTNGVTAILDVDNMNGYGPETVTIDHLSMERCRAQSTCKMIFRVHRYSGRPSMGGSEGVVKVYHGNTQVGTYKIEDGQGKWGRNWWTAIAIDGKTEEVKVCTNSRCT